MFIVRILRSLFGYVTINVYGSFCERFLNLLSRRNIQFWNVRKNDEGGLTMCVARSDFKRLREICRDSSCRVKIKEKQGTPFLMFKYRRRYGFFAGFVCFFLLLWLMTSFIWSVEIIGVGVKESEKLLETLNELGLHSGVRASKLDTMHIKNAMLLKHEDLAFIGITIKGTKVEVEIRDRIEAPKIVPKDKPCHLISNATGQIVRMEVREGESAVTENQAVLEGDLLVNGVIETKQGLRYVHSLGDIYATTYYTKNSFVPYKQEIRSHTGRKKDRYSFKILNFNINLFINSSISYEEYDKIVSVKEPNIGGNFVLPFSMKKTSYYEVDAEEEQISKERAEEIAAANCDEQLFSKRPGVTVLSREVECTETDEGIELTVHYVCEENIASQQQINE